MGNSNSTSPLGDCVVCGQRTTKRCSSCASHGTDWMYFCSREHQKLVWKVHKSVCGPRSNPFSYPGYSRKEVDDWLTLSEDPMFQPIFGRISQVYGGAESVKDLVQNLKDPGLDQQLSTREILIFAGIRGQMHDFRERYDIARGVPASECRRRLATKYPFNALACVIQNSPIPELIKNPAYASWSTPFQHKFLFCLFFSNYAHIETTRPILRAAEYTTNEMKRFAREVVAVTHPKEAKLWLDWMAGLAQSLSVPQK